MSLRAQAVFGIQWLSSSTALTVLIQFAQTAALSRLLEPRDFGLTAMIWVFLGFAPMFADAGVSNAVIQRRDVTRDQLSSVYWLNVLAGCLIAALSCLSAPLLVAYFHEPELAGLVPWVAATFVMMALGQQFQMLAQRELEFQRLAIGDILGAVVSATVAVGSAGLGAGAYSLVYGGLGAAAARAAWLISRGWTTWRPRLCFQRSHLRGFVRFGLFQIGDRITNYIWSNADYMLVGRILGSGPLGIYRLAYETVVRPLATVNPILNAVAYPVFSKRQEDDEKLRAGLKEMIQIIATIVFPMMAGLFVLAPLAVEVVFGPKWMPVAALIQILSPLGVLRSLLNPVASLLIAKGRVDKLFYLNLGLALVLPPGYWLAAPHGLHALSWSAVGLLALVMIVSWKTLYWGTIRMSAVEYLGGLAKPALFSVAMAITVYALRSALEAVIPLAALRLAVLVMLGASFYALLQVAFNRAYLMQLYSYRTQPVEEG